MKREKKQKLENYLLQFWKLMPRRENTVNFILTSDLIKMKYHFRSKAQFCARQMKTMILVYIEDLHNQEENNNFRTIIYVFENSKKRQETEDFTVIPYTLPASTFIFGTLDSICLFPIQVRTRIRILVLSKPSLYTTTCQFPANHPTPSTI